MILRGRRAFARDVAIRALVPERMLARQDWDLRLAAVRRALIVSTQRTALPDFGAGLMSGRCGAEAAGVAPGGVSRHLLRRHASSGSCDCPRTAM